MASIKENLQKIRQNIEQACMRAGRRPDEVRIVAVTKYVNEARAREAVEAGLTHIGENALHSYVAGDDLSADAHAGDDQMSALVQ